MGDELKSAYDLAMERLRRKDREAGKSGPKALSEEQKERIAALRQEYAAKLAERELLLKAERQGALGDAEKAAMVEDSFRRDVEFLTSQRDARIAEVKEEKS